MTRRRPASLVTERENRATYCIVPAGEVTLPVLSVHMQEDAVRIKRTVIIPAILALPAAGSIIFGSAVSAMAAAPGSYYHESPPAVHVLAAAPSSYYHE